jgi:tetratricopeptide (TPR) repeat protein
MSAAMIFNRLHLTLCVGLAFLAACASEPRIQSRPQHVGQAERQLRLGTNAYRKGCHASAMAHFEEAHERFAAADHLAGVANSLNGIANVYYRLDENPSAVRVYGEAIEIYALIGDISGLVRATVNQSAALIAAGRLSQASANLDRADTTAQKSNTLLALRLKTRALIMLRRGDLPVAHRLLVKALDAASRNDSAQIASVHYTMGQLLIRRDQTLQAIDHLRKALSIDRANGAYENIAKDLEALGTVNARAGRGSEAVGFFKRSLKIYTLLGRTAKVQQVMEQLTANASEADIDIQAVLFWVHQWLDGKGESNLCP